MSPIVLALKMRRGMRPGRAVHWLALGLTTLFGASACLDEVEVPPCVYADTCGRGGGGKSGASFGGKPANGGSPSAAGNAGVGPLPEGGSGGSDSGGSDSGGSDSGGSDSGGSDSNGGDSGGAAGGGGAPPGCEACLIRQTELNAPCAGRSYRATLSMRGGQPPFSWSVSPNLDGWSITASPNEPTQAILQSTKVAPGPIALTVHATDATGGHVSRDYELMPRTACWFAYTARSEQGSELRVVDPLASPPEPIALQHNTQVFDFAFSPDGKHLAYSYGASETSPRGEHLALLDLETLQEEALSFGEDRISAFAWSPDSTTLAAGFVLDDAGYLGAIRVPGADSKLQATLTPTPAFVDTNLYWVGNQFVAYHAPVYEDFANRGTFIASGPNGIRTAFYAELGATGFAAQEWSTEPLLSNTTLQATESGFFTIAPDGFSTFFHPILAGTAIVEHYDLALVAPSGRYTAAFESAAELRVLSAELGSWNPFVVADDECAMPLAWAPGAERLACLVDVPNAGSATSHGELRIFDLDSENEQLQMSTLAGYCEDDVATLTAASCAQSSSRYAYATALAKRAARAFSASGRRFAFTALHEDGEVFLYTADLAKQPFGVERSAYLETPGQPGLATSLSFSPDETKLLFQAGPHLRVHDLETSAVYQPSSQLTALEHCTEDFTSAPRTYCGNTEQPDRLPWSPNSKAFAFRTNGALTVAWLKHSTLGSTSLAATECDARCSGRFGFQPEPPSPD
jgi:hypothetical protein